VPENKIFLTPYSGNTYILKIFCRHRRRFLCELTIMAARKGKIFQQRFVFADVSNQSTILAGGDQTGRAISDIRR
jgi:hypothetical protein